MDISKLAEAINEACADYENKIYKASNTKGLDAGAKVLIEALKNKSPVATGKFKKGWTQKKKYKGRRYVGNSVTTDDGIPLSNILEYGKDNKPFIKATFEENINNITAAYVNAVKSEV